MSAMLAYIAVATACAVVAVLAGYAIVEAAIAVRDRRDRRAEAAALERRDAG